MAFYSDFADADKVTSVGVVTSGIWQDGVSNITTFFTSSTQYTNTGDYSIDIYRYDPQTNASASVQFGIAYGHVGGSGSLGTKGATGDRTTAAVFGQINISERERMSNINYTIIGFVGGLMLSLFLLLIRILLKPKESETA